MRVPRLLLIAACSLALSSSVDAQILERVKEAAEDELGDQVERMIRSGVACVFDNLTCIRTAQESGEDVYLTDREGQPVVDEEGQTVSDPNQAAELLGEDPPSAEGTGPGVLPGEGASVNTDFVAGTSTLLAVDYAEDNLGDFPRRFELIEGSFEVIEWQGKRYLRALSGGAFAIVLPETLPEKFTLETEVSVQHGNARFHITPVRPEDHRGSVVQVRRSRAGIDDRRAGPQAMTKHNSDIVVKRVAPLAVMADGEHLKVYLDGNRVANVPNAIFPRSDTLFVSMSSASPSSPIVIGPFRVAASEVDLYDRLARDGRVTTHGILFDTNSDAIRLESAATIDEIGTMLQEHPDLRIGIEGHTDSDGDEAFNRELSERRAEAVKGQLVESYGIDPSRLETTGYGESRPVASNDTPEGKQQNRRVELVRLP